MYYIISLFFVKEKNIYKKGYMTLAVSGDFGGVKINGSECKGVNGNLNIWDKGCFPAPTPAFEVIGSFCFFLFFWIQESNFFSSILFIYSKGQTFKCLLYFKCFPKLIHPDLSDYLWMDFKSLNLSNYHFALETL